MKAIINSIGSREIRFDLWINKNSKYPKKEWFNATEEELKEIEKLLNSPSITPRLVIHGLNLIKGLTRAKERRFKKWGRPNKVDKIVEEIKRQRVVTKQCMKEEPKHKKVFKKLEKEKIEELLKSVSYPTKKRILEKLNN